MTEKSMMLVQATWQDKQTFRLIPISDSCPYVECIFDPGTKVFVIISKLKRTSLQMLPKLDEYGQPIAGAKGQREERHKLDVFQEFYIEDKIAVKDLIHLFAINAKTFDYAAFMSEKEEELPVAGV
jgi:hypothetical protein